MRSDARAIPFVSYDEDRRGAPDFVYGYGEAVADGVCRPLAFRLLDATLHWRVDAQETTSAAFADEFAPQDDAPRWIVAVNMISEGVDIPRLVLAAYATVKRTDLFFRQAVGWIVRRRDEDPEDLVATVFLEFVRRERTGGEQHAAGRRCRARRAPATAVPAHRRVEDKRRALDRLARRRAKLRREIDPDYTWPQAQARVNRAMGVARRTEAGERELDAGLAFLRITGSVKAIDERLAARVRGRCAAGSPAWSCQAPYRCRTLVLWRRGRNASRCGPIPRARR